MKDLKYLFYISFLQDDRYLIFLDGLKTTLLLTFASFLLGTILGILLCAALRLGDGRHRSIIRQVMRFFLEMPTMVLLMILVYGIFGRSSVPILWCVILGLMIKAACFFASIFYSAIKSVSAGELEAARTLGMSRMQAFRFVALPQAVKTALPLYQNQCVSVMQETSVVGYLAVVDLTRAATIVSSRTLDAIIGLVTITLLYFLMGALIRLLIRLAAQFVIRRGRPL